ncbi:uncharacterized protein CIMG_12894 [Coccidioides immitis RS]|uniref:Uncharacterized protein n=1 Tax=Coccidioides immitis (strain RS) TaxID=246410 RepID=J3KGJ9_COCIM|nr:uncharacterized protein CIMG_12894 [Coccidioides immitis RS]EAS34874.3 hypothetical protein CIMG_12894 [Coccidioides immitis RS]
MFGPQNEGLRVWAACLTTGLFGARLSVHPRIWDQVTSKETEQTVWFNWLEIDRECGKLHEEPGFPPCSLHPLISLPMEELSAKHDKKCFVSKPRIQRGKIDLWS